MRALPKTLNFHQLPKSEGLELAGRMGRSSSSSATRKASKIIQSIRRRENAPKSGFAFTA